MQKITVYDIEAERISEMADILNTTDAEIVGALMNMLDSEASLLGRDSAELLEEYI